MDETQARERLFKASEKQLGDFGEQLWSNVFRASGVNYIPLSKINVGGAPMLVGAGSRGTVLPDFDCTSGEWAAYVDSKCKSQSVRYRKLDQERHGIDRPNWLAYRRVGAQFRKSAALAICELHDDEMRWSGSLLIETLDHLGEPFDGESNQAHMVYWRRKAFTFLNNFTASELFDIYHNRNVPTFKVEFSGVFARRIQREMFS